MGMGGFLDNGLNINTGTSADAMIPALLANKGTDSNQMFMFLLIILLANGGLFNNRNGAQEIGFSNAQSIDNLKTYLSASNAEIISALDRGISNINGVTTAGFAESSKNLYEQTANLTNQNNTIKADTTAGFVRTENGIQALSSLVSREFCNQTKAFADLSLQNCHNQNALLSAMNCNTQSINNNINNSLNALTGQNSSMYNYMVGMNCNINDKFKDLSCQISNSTNAIIQSQKDIASAQAAAEAARREADALRREDALLLRINNLESECHHHHRRESENANININNQISVLTNTMNALINRLATGNGNGNGQGNN